MKKVIFLTLVLCLGLAMGAFAEPAAPTNVTVGVAVVDTQELVNNNTLVTLPTPTAANYNAGYTDIATGQLTVRSNVPWRLDVRTENWSSPTGVNKALVDFQWKRQIHSVFQSSSSNNQLVVNSTPTAGTNININYRMKLDWANDAPGDYSLVQLYTLTKDS